MNHYERFFARRDILQQRVKVREAAADLDDEHLQIG